MTRSSRSPRVPEAFDEMLAKIWQQSSGVSQQLVDDMDADIDLMALTEEIPDNEDLLDNDENSPVIRLINAILGEAVKDGASDIHIETFERTLSIRFRVDGVLRPVLEPARKLAPLLVSRIKVMSKLDIAEKRLPGWPYLPAHRSQGDRRACVDHSVPVRRARGDASAR